MLTLVHGIPPSYGDETGYGCFAPEMPAFEISGNSVKAKLGDGKTVAMPEDVNNAQWSFCYLNSAQFENIDDTGGSCTVKYENNIWKIKANTWPDSSDGSAACGVQCLYFP